MAERVDINVIAAQVDAADAQRITAALDEQADASIGKRVYYPYFHIAASCRLKSLFARREIAMQCLVDGCRGVAATADAFEVATESVSGSAILEAGISTREAERQARRYLSHSLGKKTRSIANFEVNVKSVGLVYKGFWLAECGRHALIVDSVTGFVHKLGTTAYETATAAA